MSQPGGEPGRGRALRLARAERVGLGRSRPEGFAKFDDACPERAKRRARRKISLAGFAGDSLSGGKFGRREIGRAHV